MTALVSGDDMPMGRVLPKVFADVPSAEELRQANEAAKRARSRSGGLLIVTLVLAGALIAAIAFIGISAGSSPAGELIIARDKALAEVEVQKGQVELQKIEAQKARDAADGVRAQFANFQNIANIEAGIRTRRGEIYGLITQAPTVVTAVGDKQGWKAYNNQLDWLPYQNNGDWRGYVADNLQRQSDTLDGLKTKIDAFIRTAGIRIVDQKPPCTSSHPNYPDCR